MPITAQTPLVKYIGNGSTTEFPFQFKLIQNSDLVVYLNSVITSSGYYISGIESGTGGTVTFYTAPAVDVEISIERHVPLDRATDYLNGGALEAETLDDDFDRIVMMIQDLKAFNEYANISYVSKIETFTATAGQTLFNTINLYRPNRNAVKVYVNGVYQTIGANWTETSSNSITFTSGLEEGDFVTIQIMIGSPLGTAQAENILITDSADNFVSENVEGALTEIVNSISGLQGSLNFQPLDADLTAIANLPTNVGVLKKTGANTWMLDPNPTSINTLSDVLITGLLPNQVLIYNGTTWVNVDGTSLSVAVVQDTQPLVGADGQLWFDDNTSILKVYANGDWQNLTLDDQFF